IAYRAGGAIETIEEGVSGSFFTEQSWEALADAVIRFRYQQFDPETIRQRAQKFSVQHFVEAWQSNLDKILNSR
ncbi:MAG: glycosyltransferase family 4 protein, partial [Candidatus Veblenbacteria bacterium]|nr:glycosyltransferase family 4 protein [Candidatus Veblenbacteria bacterium]